jgi:nucleoside phosphorylase
MKFLVTFAVEAEFAPWKKRHRFRKRELPTGSGGPRVVVYEAQLGGNEVIVFLTGMGWGNAEYALREVMNTWPVFCISAGLAGGLKLSYQSGEVVVARRVGLLGSNFWIECGRPEVRAAVECGARFVEICLTADNILSTAKAKRAAGVFGDMVDMESFHILTAASGKKLPGRVVVRAISDTVDEDLPVDFTRVAAGDGRLKYGKLASAIGRKPQQLPKLIRFGIRSRRAAQSLAEFLDRYIPMLQDGTKKWSNEPFEEAVAR